MNDAHNIHSRLLEHDKQLTRLETALETVDYSQAEARAVINDSEG